MYFENVKGFSAFDTNLILIPGAIVMGIMNPIKSTVYGMNISSASIGVLTFIRFIIASLLVKKK